jgi:hypothetical protein
VPARVLSLRTTEKTERHRAHNLLKEIAMSKAFGIILIALGLFGLAWGGFTYTTREKVVDIGRIHATATRHIM